MCHHTTTVETSVIPKINTRSLVAQVSNHYAYGITLAEQLQSARPSFLSHDACQVRLDRAPPSGFVLPWYHTQGATDSAHQGRNMIRRSIKKRACLMYRNPDADDAASLKAKREGRILVCIGTKQLANVCYSIGASHGWTS